MMVTFSDIKRLKENGFAVKVKTQTGFEEIGQIFVKRSPGFCVYLNNGKSFVGANNHLVLNSNNEWISLENVLPGESLNGVEVLDKKSVACQTWIDFEVLADHQSYIQSGVIHHNSGKSLIQYIIIRYLLEHHAERLMLVVPSTALVFQMTKDFADYSSNDDSFDADTMIHHVMSGKEKTSNKPIVISTWQSQMKMTSQTAHTYDAILVDECSGVRGVELVKLLDKCTESAFKYGFTGTLNKSKTDKMQIQAMLGPVLKVTETRKLIDDGYLAAINIKCLTLDYTKDTKAMVSKNKDYHLEVDFLVSHERRNKFIRNLTMSLDGNTLVLYTLVEKHGDVLDKLFQEKIGDRKYFYLHGGVDAEDRDDIRPIVESSSNAVILASYGVFAQGVNIKRIHNIVLASPTKSVIRLLQSIGRGLRTGVDKEGLVVYDISDDLSNSKSRKNFTYGHFIERLKIFNEESFDYTITKINIE